MFDQVRWVFAVLWLVSFPVLLFWVVLHSFVGFWRRMGATVTYVVLLAGCVGLGAVLFAWRGRILAVEFGVHPVLVGLAAVLTGISAAVDVRARRHLKARTLVGLPELRGESDPEALLDDGIYGRIRHPRYVGAALGYVASACLANYLFLWGAAPLFLLLVHTIVLLEERELVARFGAAYADYMARVPRYLPRLTRPPAP